MFPFGKVTDIHTDCILSDLNDLVADFEIILIGTAQDSNWVRYTYQGSDIFDLATNQSVGGLHTKTGIETHTIVNINNVIKGNYENEDIVVKTPGGCNLRTNSCVLFSGTKLEEGSTYLLFLTEPNERGAYEGIDTCRGEYKVNLDSQGNIVGNIFYTYTQEDLFGLIK